MYHLFSFPRRLELDYDSLVSGHEVKLVAEHSSFGLKFSRNDLQMKLWGSCNGLLCVFSSPRTLALVNPSTRETETIFSGYDPNIMHPFFGGFGYDSLSVDYKVVSIDGWAGHNPTVVYVYSLKDSAWSRIGDFPHDGRTATSINAYSVHMDGVIYWITSYGSEPALSITALDLTKQQFSRIPTPLSSGVYGQLFAMGGNLCIGTVDYPQDLYEFWVMEMYGVLESWRRIGLTLTLGWQGGLPSLLDIPRSNEALIIFEGSLFIYNHMNGSLKEVNIGEIPTDYFKPFLNLGFSYTESIVALQNLSAKDCKASFKCSVELIAGSLCAS
ncbi:hypothetical protein V6N11_065615 [Hibiscus sabdariffa]|uniref:F-box associated beta-propeller type 1 domain-containing protein n=1 Tax=Hibiscus sabdariffa TaxID=183260 RepID=A0ABR2PHZ2_9ROSI